MKFVIFPAIIALKARPEKTLNLVGANALRPPIAIPTWILLNTNF